MSDKVLPIGEANQVFKDLGNNTHAKGFALATLMAGEDPLRGWQAVEDGATQGYHLIPTPTATGGDMPSERLLGTTGNVGDYLKDLHLQVRNNTNAAVFLSQDGDAPIASGTAGTAPSASTTVAVTASANVTATQNQYAGRIVKITYIPTGGASAIVLKRRITAHAAFAATTALSFTVSHAVPAGAAITAWQLEPASSFEVIPYNTPVGRLPCHFGERSVYGGWRVHADSGVDVHATGNFT